MILATGRTKAIAITHRRWYFVVSAFLYTFCQRYTFPSIATFTTLTSVHCSVILTCYTLPRNQLVVGFSYGYLISMYACYLLLTKEWYWIWNWQLRNPVICKILFGLFNSFPNTLPSSSSPYKDKIHYDFGWLDDEVIIINNQNIPHCG